LRLTCLYLRRMPRWAKVVASLFYYFV
jgi:hypothetical protein